MTATVKTAVPQTAPGPHIGRSLSRVDGRAKVTGSAKYAGEFAADGLLYGVIVNSAITKGRITRT